MNLTRRLFLGNLFGAVMAAPAIVHVASIMPVKAIALPPERVGMIVVKRPDGSRHWLDLLEGNSVERTVRDWLISQGGGDARWFASGPYQQQEYGVIGHSWESNAAVQLSAIFHN